MTIQVGNPIPNSTIKQVTPDGFQDVNMEKLCKGKTIAIFAVPGAFTPVCSATHLPGFNKVMDQFKSKGIEVACLSVNDPFVMKAWGDSTNSHPDMALLADWDGQFTKAVGLEFDGSGAGLGVRSQRYSMLVKDGVVTVLNIEDSTGVCDKSSADRLLKAI